MDKASRRNRILGVLGGMSKSACAETLGGWQPGELLGEGTVGTVWMACENSKNRRCGALKVQEIGSAEEEPRWRTEVDTQRRFAPFAPEVMSSCLLPNKASRQYPKYGAIVMEIMQETLYERLGKRLNKKQIDKIGGQILEICRFLASRGAATHGDLALFNLAFDDSDDLKLIDFDRAYIPPSRGRGKVDATLSAEVDFYRLQMECYKSIQSHDERRVDMDASVLSALRKWVPRWAEAFGLAPAKSGQAALDMWIAAYETYCKKAGVLCLGS